MRPGAKANAGQRDLLHPRLQVGIIADQGRYSKPQPLPTAYASEMGSVFPTADASEMMILGRSSRNGHQHERRTARHNCANSRISLRVTLSLPTDQTVRYGFVSTVLKRHRYFERTKGQRGVLFVYLQRLIGYTRQHLTKLIARYGYERSLAPLNRASRTSFGHRDGPDEVKLLAEVDSLHDILSGPATKAF